MTTIVCQECGYHNPHDSEVEKFWNQVDKTGECWLWVGNRDKCGYGKMSTKEGPPSYAHRFVYEMANGPIPKGLSVLHSCDVPNCVRLEHLSLGTQADNMRDMREKGRYGSDPRKLSQDEATEVKRLYAEGVPTKELAAKHNVAISTMRKILSGKRYKEC